ncbi:MAG TPA: hypothetical protein VHY37_03730 [Tepidisphaeraceae bacterium]|jgi:hypothetical protein|nr:hypothetical protein [Tepidisphaeraceae bacterium]
MTPAETLFCLIGASAAAAAIDSASQLRRRAGLRALARKWQMHYSERDQLRLAPRVAEQFPIPGIANLQISDIIYARNDDVYRYVFTAQYTTGVIRTKHRPIRVASFVEPRDSRQPRCTIPIQLAPADMPLLEQYQSLANAMSAPDAA